VRSLVGGQAGGGGFEPKAGTIRAPSVSAPAAFEEPRSRAAGASATGASAAALLYESTGVTSSGVSQAAQELQYALTGAPQLPQN
jgi:hypothetical protein